MQCSHCNQEHPEGTLFCPQTGNKITIPNVCPKCGKPIDPNWLYCNHCGRKLIQVEEKFNQQNAQATGYHHVPITPPELSKPRARSPIIPCLIMAGGIGVLITMAVVVFIAFRNVPVTSFRATIIPKGTTTPLGRIAFVSNRDGNAEIYVMETNGSNQTRLTNNFEQMQDGFPAWSPDGQKIAFVSNRDDKDEIYVMNADCSNQIRLTDNQAGDYYPDWSPDGKKIAFVS
ncbi:MAG: zinc-ribbon domain-containing protein, partial [Anaerolineales bacterium]|nr:zinc-ribbon domain-containing protein [Anaerolineales bacterium]